jgi:hypothetical protein
MRNRNWIGLFPVGLLASACVGGGGPASLGEDDDEDAGGPPARREQLFVSPAGQPFRAQPGEPYPVAAWFAAADRDHDGRLTREESRADAEAWFKVLDASQDEQLDMPEATRWEEELVPEIARGSTTGLGLRPARRQARARNSVDTRLQGAGAYSLINEPHPIRGADADFSMSVSRAEWRIAADRRFALLDLDGDGVVALADLRATPVQAAQGTKRKR